MCEDYSDHGSEQFLRVAAAFRRAGAPAKGMAASPDTIGGLFQKKNQKSGNATNLKSTGERSEPRIRASKNIRKSTGERSEPRVGSKNYIKL